MGVEAGVLARGFGRGLEGSDRKARARTGGAEPYRFIVMHEAGLDGFWLHRVAGSARLRELCGRCGLNPGDAPSRGRAKTDRIDGAALLRALMAFKRGEPRVCSMVRAPSAEAEDERRACRERKRADRERGAQVDRIKGLLHSQGVRDYEPLRSDRRGAA